MSTWAEIGAKCVCIDDGWSAELCSSGRLPARLPRLNEILTISGICEHEGRVFLGFEEVPDTGSNGGWFFLIEYFRPPTKQEQDVQLFAHLLVGNPVPADHLETV